MKNLEGLVFEVAASLWTNEVTREAKGSTTGFQNFFTRDLLA
jgi:hypothetical protein